MCVRSCVDLCTDWEFLMKFILFCVVILTKYIMWEPRECIFGTKTIELVLILFHPVINSTLMMAVIMMVVLGLDEQVRPVSKFMLPLFAILHLLGVIVFGFYYTLLRYCLGGYKMVFYVTVPGCCIIYAAILIIDAILGCVHYY